MAADFMETVIEFQRRTLEGSQHALEGHIEFQRWIGEALRTGISSGVGAQQCTVDVSRRVLEAIEATVPGAESGVEQIRQATDEQFDAMADAGDHVQAMAEKSVDDERAATASLDIVSAQLDLVTEAHAAVEANTLELLDETEAQLAGLDD